MKNKLFLCAVAASALGATACHAPTPEEIAKTTAEQTSALVHEAGESAQAVNGMSSLSALSSSYHAMGGGTCTGTGPCEGPKVPSQDDFDQQLAKLSALLKERVFIDKNLEARDAFSATFKLNGEDVCTDGTSAPEQTCVEHVNKSDLHVKAWPQLGGGMHLQILVGPGRNELVVFELSKTTLAAITDLAQARKALEFMASATQAAPLKLPDVMQGRVETRLLKNGTQDFSLSYSTLSDVHLEWTDSSHQARTFDTAAKSPLAAWRMEAPKKRITFTLDLGQTKYTGPYKPDFSTSGLAGTKLTLLIGGLSGQFLAEEGQDKVLLAHLGLGDGQSFLKLDDKTLFTADLNPGSGRHFDLAISKDTNGTTTFQLQPEFDLSIGAFLQALTVDQDVAARIPSPLLNETYHLQFNGSRTPTFQMVPANSTTGAPGSLKIVSGTLTFAASGPGVDTKVTVGAGQCLGPASSGGHPGAGPFAAQSCP